MIHSDLPLIRTKLAPPRIGNAPVQRSALLQRLEERRDRTLTLVMGPAGCGKTMLLTQWRKSLSLQGAKVAWYNVSADDNDDHVIAYLIEGLMQAGVNIDTEAVQAFRRSGGKSWKPLIASLIDDLCDEDRDVYVIIDDLHHVSSFKLLQMLDAWLSMAPERFHLVLGSRTSPPLQLNRLRTTDSVTEVRFSDLRFSLEETRFFLQSQGLSGLSSVQEMRLHEMSDGWAAGLQLLVYSLRQHKTPEQFFESQRNLSLSQAEALEQYLETTVSQQLSAAELGFLVRVSACRRFNRELCQQLTGDPASGELLARFEKENLFLIPIDTADAEPWYRFHRLFATFLHRRLAKLGAAEIGRIHNRASHWFSGKDLLIEAMRHAMLAGDTDFAVQLIDRTARRFVHGANFVELLKWCDALPRASLRGQLNVLLCVAWAQLSCGRTEDFERTMADVAAHADSGTPSATAEARVLRAYQLISCDETAQALRLVDPMMQDAQLNPFQTLMVSNIASLCLVYGNQFERAREVARLRHQIDIRERPDRPRPLIDVVAGLSYLVEGNIALARSSLSAFINDIEPRMDVGLDASGMFSGYLMEALYQSNELREARDLLDQHLDPIDAVGSSDGLSYAYRTRARIELLRGNVDEAQKVLSLLEEFGYRRKLERTIAWALQEKVAVALHSRQYGLVPDLLARLRDIGERYADRETSGLGEIAIAVAVAKAHAAFVLEGDTAALAAIDAARAVAARNRRQLFATRLGLMRAMVLHRGGQQRTALAQARDLVRDAAAMGMKRVLPDLGPPALPLIASLLEIETAPEAKALLDSAHRELSREGGASAGQGPAGSASSESGVEVLSAREIEILELLSRALSAKTIARTLNLSLGTIKWHMRNVYGKLHANSREEALAKARELHILR